MLPWPASLGLGIGLEHDFAVGRQSASAGTMPQGVSCFSPPPSRRTVNSADYGVVRYVAGEHEPPAVGGESGRECQACLLRKRGHAPDVGPVGVHHVDLPPPRAGASVGAEDDLPPVRGPRRLIVEVSEWVSLTTPVPSGFILKMSLIGSGRWDLDRRDRTRRLVGTSWLPDRPAVVGRSASQLLLVGEVLVGYPGLREAVRVLTLAHYAAVLPRKRGLRWWWCDQVPRGPANTHNQTASIASSVVIRLHITLPLSSVRHDRMHVVAVAASDHARLICTRHLRRANPSTSGRASSESQCRRSRCPHSGHRRTYSPPSSTASRYWNSSPPQSQLSRTGVSSCSSGLASTGAPSALPCET